TPGKTRPNLWQRLRSDLDDHAFGPTDFLERVEDSRISSECCNHCLVDPENGCAFLRHSEIALTEASGSDGDRRCRRGGAWLQARGALVRRARVRSAVIT